MKSFISLDVWFNNTNEGKMAKYWTAKEITISLCGLKFEYESYDGRKVFTIPWDLEEFKYCTQLFKKEWFRK